MSGGIFENLEFEINFANSLDSNKINASYGLFMNSLQNSYITNCDIVLNLPETLTIDASASEFNATSVGLFFGSINNSVITGTNFVISGETININYEQIENIGLIAGTMVNTSINNSTFTFDVKDINLSSYAQSANFGLVAGRSAYSTFANVSFDIKEDSLNISDNYDNALNIANKTVITDDTANTESKRSSTPPCPGNSLP